MNNTRDDTKEGVVNTEYIVQCMGMQKGKQKKGTSTIQREI